MKPLFKIDPACPTPIPVLRVNPDQSPRESDGKHFFELDQAAAHSGMGEAELAALWKGAMRDLLADGEVVETVTDATTDTTVEAAFESMSDAEIAERVRRRRRGEFTMEEYAEFVNSAKAYGYNLEKRECYPRRLVDETTGVSQIVAVATIEVLEDRVLRSGVYDGMDGPWFRGPETGSEWVEGWSHETPPAEAKIVLHRKGVSRPLTITGTWRSYALFPDANGEPTRATADRFWQYKGDTQLPKCLRARGYRELFRDVVGGAYIAEELPSPTNSHRRAARDERARDRDEGNGSLRIERDDAEHGGFAAVVAPRTEQMLRSQLALLGVYVTDQDRYIADARAAVPDDEATDPESFYGSIYAKARQERRPPARYAARPARRVGG